MTQYYFHVFDDEVTEDEEGAELADFAAAHRRAVFEARVLAADMIRREGRLVLHHRIEIEQGGETVAVVSFADAVTLE